MKIINTCFSMLKSISSAIRKLNYLSLFFSFFGMGQIIFAQSSDPFTPIFWSQWTAHNQIYLRAISFSEHCPTVKLKQKHNIMKLRTHFKSQHSSGVVCELPIPRNIQNVSYQSTQIVTKTHKIKKIAIIGDTGIRPTQSKKVWPLAKVAEQIRKWKPDLIIHVGDYVYTHQNLSEENKLQSWFTEFFEPLKTLLPNSPWIFVRGNQEQVGRSAQGWFAFLSGYPYQGVKIENDIERPYQLTFNNLDFIVHDSATADPEISQNQTIHQKQLLPFLKSKKNQWLLTHRPPYGLVKTIYNNKIAIIENQSTLLTAVQLISPVLELIISGHIHAFESIDFDGTNPPQIVVGTSGVRLESYPLPENFDYYPAFHKIISQGRFLSKFGFFTLTRRSGKWYGVFRSEEGKALMICSFNDKRLNCEKPSEIKENKTLYSALLHEIESSDSVPVNKRF